MVDYFHRWYLPNNMAIVLAGDIDAATALPVLERTLGQLTPGPLSAPEPASIVAIAGRQAREVVVEDRQGVTLAWHTVPVTHRDEPALVVMDWLMDNATSGLLNTELELTQKVPNAGSYGNESNEAGYWVVQASARDDQDLGEVERMLLDVVAKLKAGEFTQSDIDAIVLNQAISEKRQLESNSGRVSKMASAFIERRTWTEQIERDERLRAVTREDVLRVATQYLGGDFIALHRKKGKQELPKIEKPSITPLKVDPARQSPFAKQVLALPAAELEPQWLTEGTDYVHVGLPAGPMIAALNERNDLFDITYTFDRGESRARMLCHALNLLDESGYSEVPAEQLRKRLFALGTSISFGCGDERSSINVEGVDHNMEESIELLRAWLRSPALDKDTLARLTRNELADRQNTLDNSRQLGRAASNYARYAQASPQLRAPSNRELAAAKVKKLAKLITTLPDYQHRTLYFGPRQPDEIEGVIALGTKHRALKPIPSRRFRATKGVTIYFMHRETAKSNVTISMPLGVQDRALRPIAQAYGEYLGGDMSSLIFQEIREARGLAYSAYATVSRGRKLGDDWALLGGLGTQVDKTPDALTTYLSLVREWEVKDERFAAAKVNLEQSFRSSRVEPRWVIYWVQSWDRLGERSDPRPWLRAEIGALETAQVRAFAARFTETPVIISIVGDRSRVDLARLETLGEIIEIKPAQVFSYGPFPTSKARKARTASGTGHAKARAPATKK
jgi:predicted Zn-dependent peptidase